MYTQAGEVWTAAMCVAAVWGNRDLVHWMNETGLDRNAWIPTLYAMYEALGANHQVWLRQAEASPGGPEHLRLAAASPEPSSASQSLAGFAVKHGFDWAEALVVRAEEVCRSAGVNARDHLELRSLKGVTEHYELCAAGAQLLPSSSLV